MASFGLSKLHLSYTCCNVGWPEAAFSTAPWFPWSRPSHTRLRLLFVGVSGASGFEAEGSASISAPELAGVIAVSPCADSMEAIRTMVAFGHRDPLRVQVPNNHILPQNLYYNLPLPPWRVRGT